MADLSQTIAVIFQGRDDGATAAARKLDEALGAIDGAGGKLQKVGDDVDRLSQRSDVLGDALKRAFALFTAGVLVRQFIDANVEIERFEKGVAAITGGGAAASGELSYLRGTADRLGLSVRDTSASYIQFLAAVKGTSLEGEPARRIFESVSGAMSALGKSSADTSGALLAIQQSISKGKVSAEELRGQLGERLPGAFNTAAKAAGVTTGELDKMLQAGEVGIDLWPKFAEQLNKSIIVPAHVEGYTASLNRLKNQLDETAVAAGKAGLFDTLTAGLRALASDFELTAKKTEAAGIRWQAFKNLLSGGSFDAYNEELKRAAQLVEQMEQAQGSGNQTAAEWARLVRDNARAAEEYAEALKNDDESKRFINRANAQTQALKDTAEAFKVLGVSPEKAKKSVEDFMSAFNTLATSGGVNGSQLLAGLESVLKNIEDKRYLPTLKDQLQKAWEQGRITSDELAKGFGLISKEQEGLDKKLGITTKAISDQAKEAKQAAEKVDQYRLKLEELASNERIKLIEMRAQLDITNIQEQTKRVQAAFESIDNTVSSTADLIGKTLGLLAGGDMFQDSSVRNKLFEQVDVENRNRERALDLQAKLTEAQIEVLRKQADSLNRGDALIKVDGTGLKPHLEAFMWEIMRAVQVRVNQDGLKMLLGV